MRGCLIAFCAILLWISNFSAAESKVLPLGETTDWITANLLTFTTEIDSGSKIATSQNVLFRGCSFIIDRNVTDTHNDSEQPTSATILRLTVKSGQSVHESQSELFGRDLAGADYGFRKRFDGHLKQFDPTRIMISSLTFKPYVPATSVPDQFTNRYMLFDEDALNLENVTVPHLNFIVDSSKAAQLAMAFRRAIELCSGSADVP